MVVVATGRAVKSITDRFFFPKVFEVVCFICSGWLLMLCLWELA
jgi:hypothetical protein